MDYIPSHILNPRDADDFLERGIQRLDRGEADGAIADFSKAMSLDPEWIGPKAQFNRAQAYELKGEVDKAVADYTRVISTGISPLMEYSYLNRGTIYFDAKRYDDALKDFNTLLVFSPLSPSRTRNGYIDSEVKSSTFAVDHYNREFSTFAIGYYNRGLIHRNRGEMQKAIEDFSSAIKINPSDIDNYTTRGEIYLLIDQYQKAVDDCNFAETLDKNHPLVYSIRYRANLKLGNQHAVRPDCEKLLMLDVGRRLLYQTQVEQIIREQIIASLKTITTSQQVGSTEISSSSMAKYTVTQQLIEEEHYDAAIAVLETMHEPLTTDWQEKVNILQLVQPPKRRLLGWLEEWIRGNPIFKDAYELMKRNALAYLRDGYSHELNQAIISKLKQMGDLRNKQISRLSIPGVDLSGMEIVNTKLDMSDLSRANLSKADLMYSSFIGTNFKEANLQESCLVDAVLIRANLANANLSGADLTDAELCGADIRGAKFSSATILPDGDKWSPIVDMKKFIEYQDE